MIDHSPKIAKIIYMVEEGKKAKNRFSFEKALKELEQIVQMLDSGELSLDEMLVQFEKGIGLVRDCQKFLAQAKEKVEILIAEQDKLELKGLEEEEDAEEEDDEEEGD